MMMKQSLAINRSEATHTSIPLVPNSKKDFFFSRVGKDVRPFFSPDTIQPKLEVGRSGDKYEKQADRVADAVVQMKDSDIQRQPVEEGEEELQMKREPILHRKCKECEEEDIQTKANDSSGAKMTASDQISQQLQASRGSGNRLPKQIESEMSEKIGANFNNVNIHTDLNAAQMSRSLGARAFTHDNNIFFNSGEYNPSSSDGKHLLAHELTHVVQQRNNTSLHTIQKYIDAKGTKGAAIGHDYRISDDLTMAVKVGYPNHDFYAESGKAKKANTQLAAVGSGIELKELNKNFKVSRGGKSKKLKKIEPKNLQNTTSGDTMKISDDCGVSCSVVVGSRTRTAIHRDAMTGTESKTSSTSPAFMKAEIMEKLLNKWLAMPSTSSGTRKKIKDTLDNAKAKKTEVDNARADLLAATPADRELKSDIYWQKVEAYGDVMMSYYNTLSKKKREEIDKYLMINKYTDPDVGQGYTMSSGGTNYSGTRTWNFHWAGVVMKSDDQNDKVTLENYAVPGDVENTKWDFAMYGTAAKKGQTFHEQHHDTRQHGDRPTTMTIEKQ